MLASSLDSNHFGLYAYAARAIDRPVLRGEGFSYVIFRPSPWTNTVFGFDFSGIAGVPPSLAEGIAGELIPNKLRVGPSDRPADLGLRLEAAGFRKSVETLGMGMDFGRRPRPTRPGALSLETLSKGDDFTDFARLVVEHLFHDRSESSPEFARILAALGPDRAFGLLGRAEGRAVAAAYGFIDEDGVGGIYFVATEPGMRGRGYGSGVVGATLDELELRGAASCILHATELGRLVYRALGFEEICPIVQYHLASPAAS